MTYSELDKLSQDPKAEAPDSGDIGVQYAFHCLREIYDRYRAGKLTREQTETERRLIKRAFDRYQEQQTSYRESIRQWQGNLHAAGYLRSKIMLAMTEVTAPELLRMSLECISAMAGDDMLTKHYDRNRGRFERKEG